MSLKARLKAEITEAGPMSVAAFMARALNDPEDGYYATHPGLGEAGDFITAPMVSQMFGELIGLWAVETWTRLGGPNPFTLIEMGPGDGTLMADALRAARLAPAFLDAARLVLVETSQPLIERQRARLAEAPLAAAWAPRLAEAPARPFILIANELLDCLPASQFVRSERGWCERGVGLGASGDLAFGLSPSTPPPGAPTDAELGLVWESSAAQAALGDQVGAMVHARGGCALLIDYGRDAPGPGDTLQALKSHQKVDPLACPGEADLTVWADFPAFRHAAEHPGVRTALLSQGEFLRRLGIEARAQALCQSQPDLAPVISRQLHRLTDPSEMGNLYKVCAVFSAGFVPPGFEEVP
jgi:SAM-dependent MidA family methyltransferase